MSKCINCGKPTSSNRCPNCQVLQNPDLEGVSASDHPNTTDNNEKTPEGASSYSLTLNDDYYSTFLDTLKDHALKLVANATSEMSSEQWDEWVNEHTAVYATALTAYIEREKVAARIDELNNTIDICNGVIESWSKHAYSMESLANDQLTYEKHPNANEQRRLNDVTDRRAILLTSAIPKHLNERLAALTGGKE